MLPDNALKNNPAATGDDEIGGIFYIQGANFVFIQGAFPTSQGHNQFSPFSFCQQYLIRCLQSEPWSVPDFSLPGDNRQVQDD
jgi:hypothetical protein